MIDIHSHILHGLDDGAKNLDVSIGMVKAAGAAGTTDIVATPHADTTYEFQPALIRERIAELEAAAAAPVRIHHGCHFR